jgi:hypothetical protein
MGPSDYNKNGNYILPYQRKLDEEKNISQILSLKKLKNGWDFGEGEEISQDVIDRTVDIYNKFASRFKITVHPTNEGGITLSLMYLDNFFDITIRKQNLYDFVLEIGIGSNYSEPVNLKSISLNEIYEKVNYYQLLKISTLKWNLLEHSTLQNSTQINPDFKVIALKPTKKGFQYSLKNVQSKKLGPSANILMNFIQVQSKSHLFTGNSHPTFSINTELMDHLN